jgi:transposase-like protein
MTSSRPVLFRNRQFDPAVIVTCVRRYPRFSLSLRDVEELMAERNLTVDHTAVWRWVSRMHPSFASACRDS